jgi:hypothetical protein
MGVFHLVYKRACSLVLTQCLNYVGLKLNRAVNFTKHGQWCIVIPNARGCTSPPGKISKKTGRHVALMTRKFHVRVL